MKAFYAYASRLYDCQTDKPLIVHCSEKILYGAYLYVGETELEVGKGYWFTAIKPDSDNHDTPGECVLLENNN
jgi:hypothetical protein